MKEKFTHYKKVIALRRDNFIGYYNLACIQSLTGKYKACMATLRNILDDKKILRSYCFTSEEFLSVEPDFDPILNDQNYGKPFREIKKALFDHWNDYEPERNTALRRVAGDS